MNRIEIFELVLRSYYMAMKNLFEGNNHLSIEEKELSIKNLKEICDKTKELFMKGE